MSLYLDNAVPHILYDVSIPSIEERRKQAQIFPSAKHVANFLGIPPNQLYPFRTPGKRVKHRVTGKEYAVRIKRDENNG